MLIVAVLQVSTWILGYIWGSWLALDVVSCMGQGCTPDLPRLLLPTSSLSPTSPFCPHLFPRI